MPEINDVLNNVLTTLRDSGLFSAVVFGEDHSRVDMPRAAVRFRSLESHLPDDTAAGRWIRLTLQLSVRTRRGADGSEARLGELVAAARGALLADVTRGGICSDLPIGAATDLGTVSPEAGLHGPVVGRVSELTCHYETE
jgi:hypothetical protein